MATDAWKPTTLSEVVSLQRGHDLPEPERVAGGVPVMGSFGLTGWHDTHRCKGPGVTVGRSGASFGVVSYVDSGYWPLNTALYVTDFHGNDERFVYYLLKTIDFTAYNTGSAQPSLNRNHLTNIPVGLPELSEQRAIAEVLGSLDDKIEHNRRTGRKLEALARAVFKAWFVDFEPVKAKTAGATAFPGMPAETFSTLPTRMVNSELGPVPEGWEAATMGDIGVQRRDQVAPDEVDGDTPYIGLEHMPRRDIRLSDWGTAASVTSSKFRFRRGDILFGKLRPYFHKVGPAPLDGVCSTDIVVLYPTRSEYAAWLLMLVFSDDFVAHTDRSSAGTKMPRTNWKDMAAFGTAVPPAALAEAFQEQAGPMLELITVSIRESRRLAILRDYLLPRLISGRVRLAGSNGKGHE